jgi:hypothetical protein
MHEYDQHNSDNYSVTRDQFRRLATLLKEMGYAPPRGFGGSNLIVEMEASWLHGKILYAKVSVSNKAEYDK